MTDHRFAVGEQVLDRFEVVSFIGKGGFGEVYKARQLSTGQDVALKVLRRSRIEGDDGREIERFHREMKLVASLSHPHIVHLKDSAEVDGDLLMVLEHVDGEELGDVLSREGAMAPMVVRRIASQVLEALQHAHSRGVVHRDLKPSNIMLSGTSDRPVAKVLDLGIATVVQGDTRPDDVGDDWDALTETDVLLGTPAYMSPEQLSQNKVTPQSDLYAMGLLILEMLTGKRAITGQTSIDMALKQLHEPTPMPAALADTPFGQLIRRACAKKPARRYANAEAMLADLERIDVDATAASAGPGGSGAVRQRHSNGERPARSGRTLLWIGLGTLFLAAGLLAAWILLTDPSKPQDAPGDDRSDAQDTGERAGKVLSGALDPGVRVAATRPVHASLARLTSIYDAMRELESTGRQMMTLFCNCYTDQAFRGDRAACESSYDLMGELECGRQVYPRFKEDAIAYMECLRLSIDRFAQCISSCPSLMGVDAEACLEATTQDAQVCREAAPLGMIKAIDACSAPP